MKFWDVIKICFSRKKKAEPSNKPVKTELSELEKRQLETARKEIATKFDSLVAAGFTEDYAAMMTISFLCGFYGDSLNASNLLKVKAVMEKYYRKNVLKL